ncbi:hypothetical protein EDD53_2061 [Pacificibacter maritimus]|uniref:Uncharacterized protein n=1 Tax=Pacificibacter maritimus TaxID=762213 RepID=A0A3N4UGS1_9RHOB|nr:hypothetical protein EDD53_2061 [Pacificibacter maritimus]
MNGVTCPVAPKKQEFTAKAPSLGCPDLTTLSIPPIHAKLNFGRHSFGVPFSVEFSLFDLVCLLGSCTFVVKPSYGRE